MCALVPRVRSRGHTIMTLLQELRVSRGDPASEGDSTADFSTFERSIRNERRTIDRSRAEGGGLAPRSNSISSARMDRLEPCHIFLYLSSRSFVFARFQGQVIRTGSGFVIRSVTRSVRSSAIIDRSPSPPKSRRWKERKERLERERERARVSFPFVRLILFLDY